MGGNWEDSDEILHYQGLPYILEIIRTEFISRHHDDSLAGHFGIKKKREFVAKKYSSETFCHDVEVYDRG